MTIDPNLLGDLEWRGLLAHTTDRDALREALSEGSVRFYVVSGASTQAHPGNALLVFGVAGR